MYRAFASLSYSNLITSLCALLDGQRAATDTMRTSPALASVYMTSSLRPSSARPVCTRLFGLGCIGWRPSPSRRASARATGPGRAGGGTPAVGSGPILPLLTLGYRRVRHYIL